MILNKERVAFLRDIDVRVVGRIDLKRRVRKALALKLVTAGDVVDASGTKIDTRVQSVNSRVEIRSRRTAEWLKPDSEWSIDRAAISRKALVADCVAERFSRLLRERECAIEEARFKLVVRVVGGRNEGRCPNDQL